MIHGLKQLTIQNARLVEIKLHSHRFVGPECQEYFFAVFENDLHSVLVDEDDVEDNGIDDELCLCFGTSINNAFNSIVRLGGSVTRGGIVDSREGGHCNINDKLWLCMYTY